MFVHGWVCSFQPGWEWPALASFYERLSGMGRLILFDKRGTGLSDRVLGIASLEERMDDVRAVMDAAAVERAAVVGVSEGGPMCALFAATHPDRTRALVTMGSYARRNWAPDYPIGRRPEQDTWLRPTAEQWGEYAARRFLAERAPSIADDPEAIDWYTSYLVRCASPSAVAAITDMNEEIDVRPVLATVRVPALVLLPPAGIPARREPLHGRAAARRADRRGARRRSSAVGGRPAGRARPDRAVPRRPRRSAGETGARADDRARGGPAAVGVRTCSTPCSAASAVSELEPGGRGRVVRASFDGPARALRCALALADNVPALRAGIHTGECELHDGALSGPALAVAAYLAGTAKPGEVLATSTVQDLVAGSGIDFDERGTLGDLRLFSVLH